MAESNFSSNNGGGQDPSSAAIHTTTDQGPEHYMTVGTTEAEVAAMDDLQFMDAFIDSEATSFLVDSTGEMPTANLVPNNTDNNPIQQVQAIQTNTTTMQQVGVMPQQVQQQQQIVGMQPQQQQYYQMPAAPPVAGTKQEVSPLTARLNYPYATMPPTTSPYVAMPQTCAPATVSTTSERKSSSNRKRSRDVQSHVAGETQGDKQKRRIDRNQREQQRSHKITEQIGVLRDVLAGANVHFKPDKHSTLVSVADYIKQLQTRSTLLDGEHKKLLDTISKTNELVNSSYYVTSADGDTGQVSSDLFSDANHSQATDDEFAVFVNGLDYFNVFKQCGIPLAVASIDGRFMDCNEEFETLTGYRRDELLPLEIVNPDEPKPDVAPSAITATAQEEEPVVDGMSQRNLSLFNMLARTDMEQVFLAMSQMLKQPLANSTSAPIATPADSPPAQDFWSGEVTQSRRMDRKVLMNVTLVRSPQGRPKFFNCALTPVEEDETNAQQEEEMTTTTADPPEVGA